MYSVFSSSLISNSVDVSFASNLEFSNSNLLESLVISNNNACVSLRSILIFFIFSIQLINFLSINKTFSFWAGRSFCKTFNLAICFNLSE